MTQVTNPVLDSGGPGPGTIRISDFFLVASGSGRAPGGTTASRAEETVAPQAHVAPAAPGDSPKVGLRPVAGATGRDSFSWIIDRITWHAVPDAFEAVAGAWIGTQIGPFACAPGGAGGQQCDGTQGSAVFGAVELVVQPGSGEGSSS